MGVVYLARDLTLDRLVAVKVVHPDLTTNRAVAARFLSEGRAIAKLRHPNIVAVHAAGEVDGHLYYVMDYLDGETLRQRLQRVGRLELTAAVRVASDIAEALDAAATAGIVHRDLKPENILLEGSPDEPRALLADFGIARLVEEGGAHTGPGAVMGTPAYMSPEQAAGEQLDGRSDLYSLGIVTYEMLAGTPPFAGPHRTVISKQILDQPTPINQRRAEVTAEVGAAIMRALEKVPEARWPTGRSFRRALTGETVATPVAVPPRPRRKWPLLAAAAAVVVASVGLSILRDEGPPSGVDPRHSILVLPFANLRGDASYDWLRDGSVNMLTLTLSQWRDLMVVDQDRVHDLVGKRGGGGGGGGGGASGPIGLEQARRMARASRAWTVVLGDFSRLGDSLHLVARRYDVATGERLDIVQVDGLAADDVRPLFDQLAARLLDLTGAPQTNWASIASVTTNSVEAYRSYLRGVEALNNWRLGEASRALETATTLDPDFSLANYKLAITRGWISPIDTVGLGGIRRAAQTSDRLPPRDRQLIAGYRAFVDGDYDTGLSLYAQLIGRDSTDVEAWYGWADAAFHGGYARSQPDLLSQSLKGFRRVIHLDSAFALAYEHAGALLGDAGQKNGWLRLVGSDSLVPIGPNGPDSAAIASARREAQRQAVGLAQTWTRIQPNTPRAHYHLYKAFLGSGRVREARQTVTQLRALFPDSTQPFFGFLDARAQFVGGDIEGSARTVRSVLPRVKPETFREIEFAPEPISEVMTGVDALTGTTPVGVESGGDAGQEWNRQGPQGRIRTD
jgi:serine/threonine-protein kinase